MKTPYFLPILLLAVFAAGCVPDETAKGPVTLTVEVFDRAIPGLTVESGMQAAWIRAEVKKKLGYDVEFVPVPRDQEVDGIKALMAAGRAPDLSFVYDNALITSFIRQGSLTELGPILGRNAPALVKYMGPDHLWFGAWDGKQWTVPARRVNTACFSAFVRKDWLDALGMAVPKNNAEFFTMLRAFRDRNPGKVDAVIPWGLSMNPNNIDWQWSMLANSFITKMTKEEEYCLERWMYPGMKEAIRTLNAMYAQDLISPDFALDMDGARFEKDMVQGRVGAFQDNFDQPYRFDGSWFAELRGKVPDALYIPFDPFVNWEGRHAKFKYSSVGLHIFVPRSSANAVAAMKYLNWMSDPAVLFFLQNGKRGVHYLEERSGIPQNLVPNEKLPDCEKYHYMDYTIIVNGREYGDDDKNAEAASFGYPGFEELFKQAYTIAYTDARMGPRFDTIIESEAKHRQALNEKQVEILARSVTCPSSEFDATYDALVKEYMAMGGQAITEEKRAVFKRMKAAGGIY